MTSASEPAPSLRSAPALKTLLVSDLVGSTQLVERIGDERASDLFRRHDRAARDLMASHGGHEIDKTDGFLILFERPIDAVRYAVAYHETLAGLAVDTGIQVASRVGIHLGEVYLRANPAEDVARGAKPLEVEGLAKPMTARLMSLALGRQTLLTRAAFDLGRRAAVGGEAGDVHLQWLAHGAYLFKGVEEPVRVFEVGVEGFSPLAPPPGSEKAQKVAGDETVLGWRPAPGQDIPGRANWRLERKLGEGGFGEVWLARHTKTEDRRVFKFCFDTERLKGLQREVTLFRLLKEGLGARDDIARILDWRFDEPPYFLESEYTEGGSLVDWARAHDGLTGLPIEQRLELVAQVAEALAAAHSVGVLHKDLKPANVLLHPRRDGRLQARLTDFGIGLVMDRSRLDEAGITVLGFDDTALGDASSMTGTQMYMAPELIEGKLPTVQADVYALGVMLYQLAVGDLQHALAPGWERDVADELLREDIAALVDGSPERRLADAGEAARRLRGLEARRSEREAQRRAREEAEEARLALERARRRRKVVTAVVAFLAVFAVAMAVQSWRVARWARQAEEAARRAEQEAETARQVSDFLVGLFNVSKPEKARGSSITARELLDRGAEKIETELADRPRVRARLTHVLGDVFYRLGVYDRAETMWRATLSINEKELGESDPAVATPMMNLATLYGSQGRYEEARPLLERALAITETTLGPDHPDVADPLANLASLDAVQGRLDEAEALWQRARAVYEKDPSAKPTEVSAVLTNLGAVHTHKGRYAEAEAELEQALEILRRAKGEDHPQVATVLSSLGMIHEARERPDRAEQAYRDALRIREKALPADHPQLLLSRCELAALEVRQGRLDAAERVLRATLATLEVKMGPDSTYVASALVPLAEIARLRRTLPEAESLAARAVAIVEGAKGPANPELVPALRTLAQVCRNGGRLDEAAAHLERALGIVEAAYGLEHPEAGLVARDLGLVLLEQGRRDEAKAMLERALTLREGLLGPQNPGVADLRRRLADL